MIKILENNDTKLHLVIGENIPSNAPCKFSDVALYIREKDNGLKLYSEIILPYLIDFANLTIL